MMIQTYTVSRQDLKKGLGYKVCSVTTDGEPQKTRELFCLVNALKKMFGR